MKNDFHHSENFYSTLENHKRIIPQPSLGWKINRLCTFAFLKCSVKFFLLTSLMTKRICFKVIWLRKFSSLTPWKIHCWALAVYLAYPSDLSPSFPFGTVFLYLLIFCMVFNYPSGNMRGKRIKYRWQFERIFYLFSEFFLLSKVAIFNWCISIDH